MKKRTDKRMEKLWKLTHKMMKYRIITTFGNHSLWKVLDARYKEIECGNRIAKLLYGKDASLKQIGLDLGLINPDRVKGNRKKAKWDNIPAWDYETHLKKMNREIQKDKSRKLKKFMEEDEGRRGKKKTNKKKSKKNKLKLC